MIINACPACGYCPTCGRSNQYGLNPFGQVTWTAPIYTSGYAHTATMNNEGTTQKKECDHDH